MVNTSYCLRIVSVESKYCVFQWDDYGAASEVNRNREISAVYIFLSATAIFCYLKSLSIGRAYFKFPGVSIKRQHYWLKIFEVKGLSEYFRRRSILFHADF